LERHQVLGHLRALLQAGVLAAQALDLAIARIARLATAGRGLQALPPLLGERFAPLAQLRGVQTVAPQPGALLTTWQCIGLRQQALLVRGGKPPAGAPLKRRLGHHFVGLAHGCCLLGWPWDSLYKNPEGDCRPGG